MVKSDKPNLAMAIDMTMALNDIHQKHQGEPMFPFEALHELMKIHGDCDRDKCLTAANVIICSKVLEDALLFAQAVTAALLAFEQVVRQESEQDQPAPVTDEMLDQAFGVVTVAEAGIGSHASRARGVLRRFKAVRAANGRESELDERTSTTLSWINEAEKEETP